MRLPNKIWCRFGASGFIGNYSQNYAQGTGLIKIVTGLLSPRIKGLRFVPLSSPAKFKMSNSTGS